MCDRIPSGNWLTQMCMMLCHGTACMRITLGCLAITFLPIFVTLPHRGRQLLELTCSKIYASEYSHGSGPQSLAMLGLT